MWCDSACINLGISSLETTVDAEAIMNIIFNQSSDLCFLSPPVSDCMSVLARI